MNWLGDFPEDNTTVVCMFTTHDGNGAPVAPLSAFEAADIKIYKNGSNAEKTSTNGVTMTSPFDSIVGLHCITIDTSNDTGDSGFWTTGGGGVYTIVLNPDTETVNAQTALKVIGQFGIALSPALRPTVLGRTLDVTATGAGGIDWGNVENLTTVNALSSTTIASTQKVDIETIKTNPVVNGGTVTFPTNSTVATTTGAVGSVTGAVGSVTGFTASDVGTIKTKTDFLPSATAGTAGGVFIAGTNAATTVTTSFTTTFTGNLTGNVGGSVASVTGLTASDVGNIKTKTDFLPSATAGAAGGVFIAGTNAATAVTTSFTTTFTGNLTGNVGGNVTGSVGSVSGNVGGNVTGSVGSVAGAVASVSGNVGGNVTGTIGGLTAAALKDFFDTDSLTTYASAVAGSVVKEIVDNAGGGGASASDIADAVWDELLSGHAISGSAGEALTDAASGGSLSAADIADAVWEEAIADHSGTAGSTAETLDTLASLTFTVPNILDVNIEYVNGTEVIGTGVEGDTWGPA